MYTRVTESRCKPRVVAASATTNLEGILRIWEFKSWRLSLCEVVTQDVDAAVCMNHLTRRFCLLARLSPVMIITLISYAPNSDVCW